MSVFLFSAAQRFRPPCHQLLEVAGARASDGGHDLVGGAIACRQLGCPSGITGHALGWPVPRGGAQKIAGALASHYLAAHEASDEGPEADAIAVQARQRPDGSVAGVESGQARRTDVGRFLDELQFEAVREIHVANGVERDGVLLDIHSRALRDDTRALLAQVRPRATNAEAVIFELVPEAVPVLGHEAIAAELERLA